MLRARDRGEKQCLSAVFIYRGMMRRCCLVEREERCKFALTHAPSKPRLLFLEISDGKPRSRRALREKKIGVSKEKKIIVSVLVLMAYA